MCKFSDLFEAIHAFPYFHVYPSVFVGQDIEVIFSSNVIQNNGNVKMHVFILVQGCSEIVIFNVEGEESCIGDGDSVVEEQFDGCDVSNGCPCIMRVVYVVSSYGESGLVWVSLLWAVGYNYSAIGDSATLGDVQFVDKEDGICAGSH